MIGKERPEIVNDSKIKRPRKGATNKEGYRQISLTVYDRLKDLSRDAKSAFLDLFFNSTRIGLVPDLFSLIASQGAINELSKASLLVKIPSNRNSGRALFLPFVLESYLQNKSTAIAASKDIQAAADREGVEFARWFKDNWAGEFTQRFGIALDIKVSLETNLKSTFEKDTAATSSPTLPVSYDGSVAGMFRQVNRRRRVRDGHGVDEQGNFNMDSYSRHGVGGDRVDTVPLIVNPVKFLNLLAYKLIYNRYINILLFLILVNKYKEKEKENKKEKEKSDLTVGGATSSPCSFSMTQSVEFNYCLSTRDRQSDKKEVNIFESYGGDDFGPPANKPKTEGKPKKSEEPKKPTLKEVKKIRDQQIKDKARRIYERWEDARKWMMGNYPRLFGGKKYSSRSYTAGHPTRKKLIEKLVKEFPENKILAGLCGVFAQIWHLENGFCDIQYCYKNLERFAEDIGYCDEVAEAEGINWFDKAIDLLNHRLQLKEQKETKRFRL